MSHATVEPTSAATPLRAPGPRGLRAFGVLRDFQRDAPRALERLREEHGDLYRCRLPLFSFWVATHPDDVKHVLQERHSNYDKDTFDWRMLRPVVGRGLLTSDGAFWLRQRRLMQPAFHRRRIATLSSIMTERTVALGERWRDGETVDVGSEMARLTLDIVTRALFGVSMEERADQVAVAFTSLNRYATDAFYSPIALAPGLFLRLHRRARRAKATLDRIVYAIIDERRRRTEERDDLLSMLIEARDEETGEGMSDAQLRDEVMTLMIAGHETTANALTFTWYLLARHPEARGHMHAELREVLGGRPATEDDISRLVYTRMVIEESMRLYPPAWGTSRGAIEEDELGRYHVPAGSVVFLAPWVTHRHPDFWPDPEQFEPERFAPERAANRHRFAYFPFGGGPRLCIGAGFATTEMVIVLATLAQRFHLDVDPDYEMRTAALVTLRPRSPLCARTRIRS